MPPGERAAVWCKCIVGDRQTPPSSCGWKTKNTFTQRVNTFNDCGSFLRHAHQLLALLLPFSTAEFRLMNAVPELFAFVDGSQAVPDETVQPTDLPNHIPPTKKRAFAKPGN